MTAVDCSSSDFTAVTPSVTAQQTNQVMREKSLEQNGWQLFEQNRWAEAALVFDQLLEIDHANEGGLQGKDCLSAKAEELPRSGVTASGSADNPSREHRDPVRARVA